MGAGRARGCEWILLDKDGDLEKAVVIISGAAIVSMRVSSLA